MRTFLFVCFAVMLSLSLSAQSKRGYGNYGGSNKSYNYGGSNKSYNYGGSNKSYNYGGTNKSYNSGSTYKYKDPVYNNTPKTNYKSGGQYKVQDGYTRGNGKYVAPHTKTGPDNYKYNNKNYKIK